MLCSNCDAHKRRYAMEFNETIKQLRIKQSLTQEQFAQRLNVTRQAVSNWENNKNYPDLEMLILISKVFNVSLDSLILGGETMNNVTKSLINDGKRSRRAKMNLVASIIASSSLILGMVLIFIKANSVEYIDAQGMLHENFFLIPLAYLCILISIIFFMILGINFIKDYRIAKKQNQVESLMNHSQNH